MYKYMYMYKSNVDILLQSLPDILDHEVVRLDIGVKDATVVQAGHHLQ